MRWFERMVARRCIGALAVGALVIVVVACAAAPALEKQSAQAKASAGAAQVLAESQVAAGKYLIEVGGCNDCHTPGWMQHGAVIPEDQWLTGVPLGWRGPWGTTYASNLRIFAQDFDEETWVKVLRARVARPPMPWSALHAMSDADLKAVYHYIRSLPLAGEKMPPFVPPGQEPTTPYLAMEPVMPATQPAE